MPKEPQWQPKSDSRLKWKAVNDKRPRHEQGQPWPFTWDESRQEQYRRGYEQIVWDDDGRDGK